VKSTSNAAGQLTSTETQSAPEETSGDDESGEDDNEDVSIAQDALAK